MGQEVYPNFHHDQRSVTNDTFVEEAKDGSVNENRATGDYIAGAVPHRKFKIVEITTDKNYVIIQELKPGRIYGSSDEPRTLKWPLSGLETERAQRRRFQTERELDAKLFSVAELDGEAENLNYLKLTLTCSRYRGRWSCHLHKECRVKRALQAYRNFDDMQCRRRDEGGAAMRKCDPQIQTTFNALREWHAVYERIQVGQNPSPEVSTNAKVLQNQLLKLNKHATKIMDANPNFYNRTWTCGEWMYHCLNELTRAKVGTVHSNMVKYSDCFKPSSKTKGECAIKGCGKPLTENPCEEEDLILVRLHCGGKDVSERHIVHKCCLEDLLEETSDATCPKCNEQL